MPLNKGETNKNKGENWRGLTIRRDQERKAVWCDEGMSPLDPLHVGGGD
jgi:hypothetical protein